MGKKRGIVMEDTLRISGIIDESIVDGKGLRYTIFTQGCPHHCEGCHNPDTHDFEGGTEKEITAIYEEICSNPLLSGVTFSGGEPFCQPAPLAVLAEMVHKKGLKCNYLYRVHFRAVIGNEKSRCPTFTHPNRYFN